MGIEKLIALNARDIDWSHLETQQTVSEVLPPTPASAGRPAEELHEGIRAALIMAGCTAQFSINFWILKHSKTNWRTHVHMFASVDDWLKAINLVAGLRFGAG